MEQPDTAQPDTLTSLRALADETRLKILGLLADREYSVREIAQKLTLTEPTISHHLAKLNDALIVRMRAQGTTHYYALNTPALTQINKSIAALAPQSDIARDPDQKILAAYLAEDGKLTHIPAIRKKRLVILRYLVNRFEHERRYSEKEINAVLLSYHWDSATLRREFIAEKLMQRKDGVYWRID